MITCSVDDKCQYINEDECFNFVPLIICLVEAVTLQVIGIVLYL